MLRKSEGKNDIFTYIKYTDKGRVEGNNYEL